MPPPGADGRALSAPADPPPPDGGRGWLTPLYPAATRLAGPALRLAAPLHAGLRARLWLDPLPVAAGGVWLHAASVGELTSARALIEALAPHGPVQVTTNTSTARDLARGWGLAAQLAPLDVPGALGRCLDRLAPRLAITIENEIWPNRAAALTARGVPQVVLGARLSARSAQGWARRGRGLIGPVLEGLAGLSAQDAATEARLIALGLPPDRLWPRLQLKLIGPARAAPPPPSAARDAVWLAASTHEGEEEIVLDAHLAARGQAPGLRLILAPRHPVRGDAVAALIAARGLPVLRRSAGAGLAEVAPGGVLLADTLGEMTVWYRAAGLCLTGGSLVAKGGHTPWEPAAQGCAILHGPDVSNAADSYARLTQAGAVRVVEAGDLGAVVAALARAPDTAQAMGAAARAVLTAEAGDLGPLVARLRRLAGGERAGS